MADHYYSKGDVHVAWSWEAEKKLWIAHGRVGGVRPIESVTAFAAAPAERRSSFTGSGLPFPSRTI